MPGRFYLETPVDVLAARFGWDAGGLHDGPRWNVAPGQEVFAVVPGSLVRRMRWGIIPVGRVNARGRPVLETIVNARSETVFEKSAFEGVGRAVVPADGWYEWTGKARRKVAWRIKRADGAPLLFAAIRDRWEAPGGRVVDQVATVTCEPSGDVAAVHDRMGVILAPGDVAAWLEGDEATAKALAVPLTEGSLVVERADGVDWSGP